MPTLKILKTARERGTFGYQTRLVGNGTMQAPLKDISAETDCYGACQRPLNFKQVRLLNPRERESRGHVRASALRNSPRRIDPPNFDLYPACWHPSHFYRAFNLAFRRPVKRIRKTRHHFVAGVHRLGTGGSR